MSKKQVITFRVEPEYVSHMQMDDGRATVYHVLPKLSEWEGGVIPAENNPRSHDIESLTSSVAKAIETTIREAPEDFQLANRGMIILCHAFDYDPKTQIAKIEITNQELQGCSDGKTSDSVIQKLQKECLPKDKTLKEITEDEIPEMFKIARIPIKIIVGIRDRERVNSLVAGVNSSVSVKPWSLSNFQHRFDFIKDVLETENSPFAGKIAYNENDPQDVSILDIISLMSLFHPSLDEKDKPTGLKSPTISYSSKGRLDSKLQDPELLEGYKSLIPILPDILKLHDHVYSKFPEYYDKAFKDGKLGRRRGCVSKLTGPAWILPLTETSCNYSIANGFVFPLLASARSLVRYGRDGMAKWRVSPFRFFDQYGADLVEELIQYADQFPNPNMLGKNITVYRALHKSMENFLHRESLNKETEKEEVTA